MTIIVASDIHGDQDAFTHFLEEADRHHADCILLSGDIGIPYVTLPPNRDYLLVKGNCDSSYDFSLANRPLPPLVVRTTWEGRNIVMTHGDRYPSPYGLSMHKGDIFIFGHIHQSRLYTDRDGVIILNPGSLAFPRGEDASYALLQDRQIEVVRLKDGYVLRSLSLSET